MSELDVILPTPTAVIDKKSGKENEVATALAKHFIDTTKQQIKALMLELYDEDFYTFQKKVDKL